MAAAFQLNFNLFELGHQPLVRRLPPYDECTVFPALPAILRDAQKCKGFRFSLPPPFPILGGEPPN
jgi:hypothetical protein